MAARRCRAILMGGACLGVWRLSLFPTNHLGETGLFTKAEIKTLSFAKHVDKY